MDMAILAKEAMLLPESERALLADQLIVSISKTPDEIRKLWVSESEDRYSAFKRGEIPSVDGQEAMADLRKRFSK